MNIVRSAKDAVMRHKYKSFVFLCIAGYLGKKGYNIYRMATTGMAEFQDVMKEMGGEGAEGEQVGFMESLSNLLKGLDGGEATDSVDPSVATIIQNVRGNESQQNAFLMSFLKSQYHVEDLQDVTRDTSATKEEKLAAWKSMSVATLSEQLAYSYSSSIFMSISLVAFSLTGRHLFQVTSDSMGDAFSQMMQNLGEGESPPENIDRDDEEVKKQQEKQWVVNTVNTQFLGVLFEIVQSSLKSMIENKLNPLISEKLEGVTLKTEFSADTLEEMLGEIHSKFLEELLTPIDVTNDPEETDSDSEVEREEDTDEETNLIGLRTCIVDHILTHAAKVPIKEHEEKIEEAVRQKGLDSEYIQSMDVESKLENMLRELLDFIDTPYFNSMFSDLAQYNHDELSTRISNCFREEYGEDSKLYMKIITMFVRLRDHLGKNASILKDIEVPKEGEGEEETEETKVVEITDAEATAIEAAPQTESQMQEETKDGEDEPLLFDTLQTHIRNLTKYIFYEGKEGGDDDLFGDENLDLSQLMQMAM